tara:strand:+ start:970 stop:1554 length:585 start_codon:yes stop_codon:yes gene_type:complete
MIKFHGPDKLKTAVFISGNGSNFKNLVKFSHSKASPIKINLLISSNSKAKGLIYARQKKIKRKIFKLKNKIKDENKILNQLDKSSIKLICLAGFMVILSQNFIKKFKGQILNIHPSLLPKYKGLNTHKRAIENNEKYSGCTVHLVTSKLDSGKIILQKKVKINKNDKPKTLAKKILKQEHILYPKAIKKIFFNL